MKKLLFFTSVLFLNACQIEDTVKDEKVWGYRPVYVSYESIQKIVSLAPQKLRKPGKIYIKDKYLYINEIGEGIHIFDNSDKTKPQAISFISIPANQDISISNNILFADNGNDLVSIDISNPLNIKLLKRLEKAFPAKNYPTQQGKFECADPSKGYVKTWEYVELINPKCYR